MDFGSYEHVKVIKLHIWWCGLKSATEQSWEQKEWIHSREDWRVSNNTPSHFATILQVIKSFDWVLSRGMRLSKLDEVRTQIAAICSSNYYCPRGFIIWHVSMIEKGNGLYDPFVRLGTIDVFLWLWQQRFHTIIMMTVVAKTSRTIRMGCVPL